MPEKIIRPPLAGVRRLYQLLLMMQQSVKGITYVGLEASNLPWDIKVTLDSDIYPLQGVYLSYRKKAKFGLVKTRDSWIFNLGTLQSGILFSLLLSIFGGEFEYSPEGITAFKAKSQMLEQKMFPELAAFKLRRGTETISYYEFLCEQALLRLMEADHILGFAKYGSRSQEDLEGVDFTVYVDPLVFPKTAVLNGTIDIQVKGMENLDFWRQYTKRYKYRGKKTALLAIPYDLTVSDVTYLLQHLLEHKVIKVSGGSLLHNPVRLNFIETLKVLRYMVISGEILDFHYLGNEEFVISWPNNVVSHNIVAKSRNQSAEAIKSEIYDNMLAYVLF